MVNLKEFADAKLKELIGERFDNYSFEFTQFGGSIRYALTDSLNSMPPLPAPYIPVKAREGKLRAGLKGIEERIYNMMANQSFYVSQKPEVDALIIKIAKKAYENPRYAPMLKQREDGRDLLACQWNRAVEECYKVHTACICGAEENPVAAFAALRKIDWTGGFDGKNIQQFQKQDGQWSKVCEGSSVLCDSGCYNEEVSKEPHYCL